MKTIFYSLLLTGLLFTACGDDDDPVNCSNSWTIEYQAELDAITAASTVWANDPSQANCDALKDAYNSYLDALEGWEDCANQVNQLTEWQAAIDAARLSADSIC